MLMGAGVAESIVWPAVRHTQVPGLLQRDAAKLSPDLFVDKEERERKRRITSDMAVMHARLSMLCQGY